MLVFIGSVKSQQFKFNHYNAEKGLPQQYIYDIEQNKSGYLWIASSEGLIKYDGDEFKVLTVKDGLSEDFSTHLYVSTKSEMWIGHNQGGITKQTQDGFKKMISTVAEFGSIVGFDETSDQKLISVGQSGKVFISHKGLDEVYDLSTGDYLAYSMAVTSQDHLLVGTESGLIYYKLKKRGPTYGSQKRISSIPEEKIQCITKSKTQANVFWIATSSGAIYKTTLSISGEFSSVNYNKDWNVTLSGIQGIFEDGDGNLWVSTYEGIIKMGLNSNSQAHTQSASYNLTNGLPGDQVKCAYQDRENNIWIGMYGSGLAMLKDEFFSFFNHKSLTNSNSTKSILIGKQSQWFGTENGLLEINESLKEKLIFYNEKNGLVSEPITSLKFFHEYILAGTSKSGLFYFDRVTKKWKKVVLTGGDNLSNAIMDIEINNNSIWVGTRGGLFELNEEFEVLRMLNTEKGMVHNSINDIMFDTENNLWVCTQGNMVAKITGNDIKLIEITGPGQSINITCITQDAKGAIWVGTYGNGVFRQEKNTFKQITSNDGLPSDYCYFVIAGNNNDVWVGHRGALSRIDLNKKRIVVFDEKDGIENDFNELSAFRDNNNFLWFGTNNGVVKFDPRKYVTNSVQPMVNFKRLVFSDKEINFTRSIELPYNNYRLLINFIGINFTNPDKVKYKYILKGFDLAWSDVTEIGQAYYPKINDGDYEFIVKACNEDGVFGKVTGKIKITVASPFWKKWWFFVICFIVLVLIVGGIIKLRERNQKKIRLYLERQLHLRTKELVEQKSLVEEKNKDITDSINYAHKIQSGILPSLEAIKKHVPDSFIMFKPRDIVSGDFYWYAVRKNRFILAVADCTGHGVPGAFMSMIGSTIFKEVDKEISNADPAMFIEHVDERVAELMNPDRKSQFQDGMDMILIDLDLKTGKVIFAGAARPLLHLKPNGEYLLHKTSSDSIGGYSQTKVFSNFEITLEKGDALYLYSDGVVDQFGGPNMKKIMTSGFIQLILDSKHLSMDKQGIYIDEEFEKWRGSEFQIDDVLVIGVKF